MKKRPQLNPGELQRVKWLLGNVLALCSAWTVFYLDVEAWTLLVLATVGIGAGLIWPGLPARIPRWVHHAAFPVIVAIFLADLWFAAAAEFLPALIRLDLMLILYRGVTYREKRDDLQLIVLGLFLVVVAGVLTVSIAFALQIVGFTACALLLLFTVTLVDAEEARDPPVRVPLFTWGGITTVPDWPARTSWARLWPRLRDAIDTRVAILAAVLFAGVVGVSALLFLAIPRFQLENSLFLERFISKKSKTGFSDNIKFGDVTDITNDDSLALSIDVTDPRQVPTPLYLRMVVLDEYREGSFKLSTELRGDAQLARERNRASIVLQPPRGGVPVYWTFYLESGISRYLPLPGSFDALSFRETQHVAASSELRVVALHNEPVSMLAYRLEGVNTSPTLRDNDFAQRFRRAKLAADSDSGTAQRRMQLGLPFTEADLAILRQSVAAFSEQGQPGVARPSAASGSGSESARPILVPDEFARRACQWLQRQHTYSMRSTLPGGVGDPLVRWISSREPGHCELFAGAFVALARTAGYPARVVSGYRTGTWNAFSDSLAVRNSEAHAWCELWDDAARAWLRVDPTPGATSIGNAEEEGAALARPRQLDASWKARLNSLRIFWYRRIVNFDQRNQVETLRALKSATQESGLKAREAMERFVKEFKRWAVSPWDVRRVLLVVAGTLAVVGLVWGGRLLLRDWRWRFAGRGRAAGPDPVRAEAGRWLLKLSDWENKRGVALGWGKGGARGRTAGGGSEAGQGPALLSNRVGVESELRRLRYGDRATWPEPGAVFQRARQALRAAKHDRKVSRRGAEAPR